MSLVKRLLQEKIERVCQDYLDSLIAFDEAFKQLCTLGYERDYARGTLDELKQLRLFPDEVEVAVSGGFTYGTAKFDKEKEGASEGEQEQTDPTSEDSSSKDSPSR